MAQMPPEQEEEYRVAFNFFDTQKTGSLKRTDFNALMRALGEDLTDQQLQGFMSGDSASFDNFIRYWREKWAKAQSGDDLREAFRFFDRGGNGSVDANELKYMLSTYGEAFSQQEADEFCRDAGGGSINYNTFIDKMKESAF